MKKTIITLVVIALVAGGAGAYYYTRPGPEPKITTSQVSRGDITEVVAATGTLAAVTEVTVGSQVGGIIQEIPVDFNSMVKRGDLLLKINPDNINTQIEQAEASLKQRQADLERNKVSVEDATVKLRRTNELFKKNLATQADLDSAEVTLKSAQASLKSSEASLTQAEASLNTQKVNLAHTIITSPIDGIIIQRAVDVGQTVQANYQSPTLFVVAADLTKMKCTANIDESEVGKIRQDQVARLRFDAYPTETFYGKVIQVRLQATTVQNVVTYGTVIEVPNLDYKLKPGMTAQVQIEIAKRTDVVRVPATAIRFRPNEEIFAALKQEVPASFLQQQRGPGRRGDMASGFGGFGGSGAPMGSGAPAGPGGQQARAGQAAATPGPGAQASPSARSTERGGGDRTQGGPPQFTRGEGGQGGPGGFPGGMPPGGFPRGSGMPQGMREGGFPGGGFAGGMPGQNGQRRGFDPNDPEARARMIERYQQMPPERQAEYASRMKERGIDIQAMLKGGKPGASPAAAGAGAGAPPRAAAQATTIDALFGPLSVRTTMGQAWLWLPGQKQMKQVRVRLGVTDGTYYELLEGDLQPGAELVTAVTLGTETNRATGGQSGNPLMQRGGMMGPPGMGGGRGH